MGARLALAVWWFWIESGYLSDGRRWIEALLALDRAGGPPEEAPHALPAHTKAYLLQVSGILAMVQGDHDRAVALHEEGLGVYRDLGHKKGVSASLRELGFVAYEQGDYERAVRLHEQSLDLAREFGDHVRRRLEPPRPGGCGARAGGSRTRENAAGRGPGIVSRARSACGAWYSRSLAWEAWRAKRANTRGRRDYMKRAWS